VASIAIENRSAWAPAAENRGNLEPMGQPRRVTIHHSAMYFRDTRPSVCAAQIQHIQKEHMGNRGYGDIGYHFLIDPAGRIWQGRDMKWQGAHASGINNRQNIGICVLGNFLRGRGGQGPNPAQLGAMRTLVRQLMQQYGFGADEVHCHSDFKPTECPGPLMESAVAQMVYELQRGDAGGRLAASVAGH
jgi:N-acetyl-anhydromuramyl-L-alanine amidase AmpD